MGPHTRLAPAPPSPVCSTPCTLAAWLAAALFKGSVTPCATATHQRLRAHILFFVPALFAHARDCPRADYAEYIGAPLVVFNSLSYIAFESRMMAVPPALLMPVMPIMLPYKMDFAAAVQNTLMTLLFEAKPCRTFLDIMVGGGRWGAVVERGWEWIWVVGVGEGRG